MNPPESKPSRRAGPDPSADLVFVGLARDCEASLHNAVTQLSAVAPPARRVRWFVVESDSSDATVRVLERLEATHEGFAFRSLGSLRDRLPARTQRIAHCRNACLDWLREQADLAPSSHVIVADLDGVNDGVAAADLLSCWTRDDWSVCAANQPAHYYDIWALRHPQWCAGDCWREYEFLSRHGIEPDRARMAAVYARMVSIPADSEWIEVDSAFGGLAVYRADALLPCRYEGLTADGGEVCEHVSVHAQIRARGGRLFINPRLVNAGAEHLDHYWPEYRHIRETSRRLWFRALLRLSFGKQASKEIRRLLRSLE
ncbi:MAG: hypothetical protein KGL43_19450 [Burkholderiales bacterium]|nr:hypothetical protein [Burkholderiales bacterium]MDE2455770.1 hypothetical protein [Burkholderiales bacterium]